jgi:hypothetical protein
VGDLRMDAAPHLVHRLATPWRWRLRIRGNLLFARQYWV